MGKKVGAPSETRADGSLPAKAAAAALCAAVAGTILLASVRFDGAFSAPKLACAALASALGAWAVFWGGLAGRMPGRRAPLDIPLAAFMAAAALSAVFSIDRPLSVLGHQGFYSYGLLAAVVYAGLYLTASRSGAAESPRWVLRAAAYAAGASAFLGLLQWAGIPSAMALNGPLPLGRIYSTLGNPVYLGAVLALAAPVCARLAFSKEAESPLAAAALAAVCAALILTQSRAAWLGAAAGLAVWAWASGRVLAGGLSKRWLAAGAAAAAVLAFSVWSRDSRRADSARIEMWKAAASIGISRPGTGVGTDAFENAFRRMRGEGFIRVMGGGAGQASAHNDFLQVFATMGFPGLAAYAACLVALVALVRRRLQDASGREDAAAAAGALAALFVQAKFDPTPLGAAVPAAVFLGLLSPPSDGRSSAGLSAALRLALALLCSGAAWGAWRMARADHVFLLANLSRSVGRRDLSPGYYAKAMELVPYETKFRMETVRFLMEQIGREPSMQGKVDLAEAARRVSAEGIRLRPGHADSWQTHGALLAALAKAGNPSLWEPAAAALDKALELDPWFPSFIDQALFVARGRGDAQAVARLEERKARLESFSAGR